MAGTNELCTTDVILEICKKEHIRTNAQILQDLKDQFCNLNTVNFIDSTDITDNGDGTYDIPVTNPASDSIVIDDNLFIYEFDGQVWTLKYSPKQSDWAQADNSEIDYIKNKPDNLSDFNNDLDTDDIPEGANNKYYTENRVQNNTDVSANTAARHTHPNKALLDNYDPSNFATSAQGAKADTAVQTETDPTVPGHVKSITQQNITDWDNKPEASTQLSDSSDLVRNDQDTYASEPKVLQIVTLTVAEYNAIVTKDPNTYYITV